MDEPIKYMSVTSLTGLLPLPWMEAYAAKHSAECAFYSQDEWRDLPTKEERVKYVKGASKRYSKTARDRGTAIHAAAEKFNLMTPETRPKSWPLPVAASMRQYQDFIDTVQPRIEAAEVKVYHRGRRAIEGHEGPFYAGTTDLICEIDGRLAILDLKTGKSVHEDAALQINAYAHADFLILDPNHPDALQITPDRGKRWYEWRGKPEDEHPLPKIEAGYVLHLRDDGWDLHEVPISDELYEMFLSLFSVDRWERETKKKVLSIVRGSATPDEEANANYGSQWRDVA